MTVLTLTYFSTLSLGLLRLPSTVFIVPKIADTVFHTRTTHDDVTYHYNLANNFTDNIISRIDGELHQEIFFATVTFNLCCYFWNVPVNLLNKLDVRTENENFDNFAFLEKINYGAN